jgi:hypothetical protein
MSPGVQQWRSDGYKTSALFTQNGQKAKINVFLTITPQLSSARAMTIQGKAKNDTGAQTYTFTKNFTFLPNQTTHTVTDIQASSAYDDKFDFIKEINWKITVAGGECDIGTTDNNIYYVPDGVQPALHRDTILYVVCRNMDGKVYEDASALTQIWNEFSDRQIMCADRQTTLQYWGDAAQDGAREDTIPLLKYRSGNCEAWSRLFRDCLKLAGKTSGVDIRGFEPQDNADFLYVKNMTWQTPQQDYGHGDFKYKLGTDVSLGGSIAGQGGFPQLQYFPVHIFVKIDSKYYDPSYDKTANTATAAEDAVLDGIGKLFPGAYFLWRNDATVILLSEYNEQD